jgi:G:T/U-mismatch repair DNA glycosylase
MRVEHRYIKAGLYTPPNAVALLIGTFPSVLIREEFGRIRTTDVDFFYGSNDNNFWKDLGIIYNKQFSFVRTEEAIQQRIALLTELRLAMSDAIYACYTTGSAMDTALQHIELNTFMIRQLDETSSITTLYFTSSSGKVNAETLTLQLLKEKGRLEKMRIVQKSGPRIRQFLYKDDKGTVREMASITLISPSPLAEQWGGTTPEKRRALYQQYLPKPVS